MAAKRKTEISNGSAITVDDGVPMPIPSGKGTRKYPWQTMEVGQSFLMPAELSGSGNYTQADHASKKYAPKKFSCRKTAEGYRMWRVV